jgi:hypothetical protein
MLIVSPFWTSGHVQYFAAEIIDVIELQILPLAKVSFSELL